MNQGMSITSPSDSQAKRRRGRPRKDDTPSQSSEKSPPSIQHFLTPVVPPSASSAADMSVDDEDKNDEMIGQVVTGVLESAFDAGYIVRVKVGNGNTYMNGVVFKEGCVVPITPENDVAPNAKMYTRQNFAIPTSFTPKVANDFSQMETNVCNVVSEKEDGRDQRVLEASAPDLNTDLVFLGHTDVSNKLSETDVALNVNDFSQMEKNVETVENPSNVVSEKEVCHDQKVLEASAPDLNTDQVFLGDIDVSDKPEEKKDETELSRVVLGDIDVSDKLEEKKDETESSKDVNEKEDCSTQTDLEELPEPPAKMQKIEEVKEALESEVVVIQPDCEVDVKGSHHNSGFQISMENAEEGDDDVLMEPASEVSVMDTENVEE